MNLQPTAQKLYDRLCADHPSFKGSIDQVVAAQAAQGVTQIDQAALEAALIQAMPEQKAAIEQAKQGCVSHQCDGKNGQFVSQLATLLIQKDRAAVHQAPTITRPAFDPLSADVIIAKDTDFAVMANFAVFDDQRRPLAMKVLVRERADMKKLETVLKSFHLHGEEPQIVKIANDTAYYKIHDTDEHEFRFGDAAALVSFDKKGEEQGRAGQARPENVRVTNFFRGKAENGQTVPDLTRPAPGVAPTRETGAQLDTSPVQTFLSVISAELKLTGALPAGHWITEKLPAEQASLRLGIGEGLIAQPDTMATVALLNQSRTVEVAANDFSAKGPEASSLAVPDATLKGQSVHSLLNGSISVTSRSKATATDQKVENLRLMDLVYPHAAEMQLAGRPFKPLADVSLQEGDHADAGLKAKIVPAVGDPEKNGVELRLELAPGFIKAGAPASLDGYVVEFCYRGPDGSYTSAESRKLSGSSSKGIQCELSVPDLTQAIAKDVKVEVRLRNPDGIPAGRVTLPLKAMKWDC